MIANSVAERMKSNDWERLNLSSIRSLRFSVALFGVATLGARVAPEAVARVTYDCIESGPGGVMETCYPEPGETPSDINPVVEALVIFGFIGWCAYAFFRES